MRSRLRLVMFLTVSLAGALTPLSEARAQNGQIKLNFIDKNGNTIATANVGAYATQNPSAAFIMPTTSTNTATVITLDPTKLGGQPDKSVSLRIESNNGIIHLHGFYLGFTGRATPMIVNVVIPDSGTETY